MTKIEWCDLTLNPIVGCSKCSPGCENCYAEKFAARLAKHSNSKISAKYAGVIDEHGKWTGKLSEEGWDCLTTLTRIMHSPPKRIFLGSMTDIFHENMDQKSLNELVDDMTYTGKRHTFLLLTKRPAHALELVLAYENESGWARDGLPGHDSHRLPKNVWLGVTVCNQQEADEKLPILMKIPAARRFVSVEPMLGPVDLEAVRFTFSPGFFGDVLRWYHLPYGSKSEDYPALDWVICGAETGPGARPMDLQWARDLREQCQAVRVPFFFKKAGNKKPIPDDLMVREFPEG